MEEYDRLNQQIFEIRKRLNELNIDILVTRDTECGHTHKVIRCEASKTYSISWYEDVDEVFSILSELFLTIGSRKRAIAEKVARDNQS